MGDETSTQGRRPRRSDPEGRRSGRARQRGRSEASEAEPRPRRRRSPSGRRASGMQVALQARDAVAEVTGLEAESVSGIQRTGEGTWKITVEVCEVERVPDTDDVMGTYEAEVDDDGELLGFARVQRYPRSRATEGQGARGG